MSYKTDEACLNCGKYTYGGNCLHHIKTRGSGGTDDKFNLMPLCFFCHTLIHKKGTSYLAKNLAVKIFLEINGWQFCEVSNKWKHFGGSCE